MFNNTSSYNSLIPGTDHVKHKFPKDMTVVNEIAQMGNNFKMKVCAV